MGPAKFRNLSNPPIVETVIDFRSSATNWSEKLKPQFVECIGPNYSKRPVEDMRQFTFEMHQKPQEAPVNKFHDQGLSGFRFFSDDSGFVVQFRQDGFSCSRMAPYTGWGTAFAEAVRLWPLYLQITGSQTVERIAVRTINRMLLPTDRLARSWKTMLNHAPSVPEGFSAGHFISRVWTCDPDTGIPAWIVHAFQEPVADGKSPVVLDIDVFQDKVFASNAPELITSFEPLHQLKNRLFFTCLTEEAVMLFV